ncbi:MAG TPA: winged helix-turn-helix domain-containing protein [Phenylobacterium sp.]|uniref:winged helix-turn-helix domain-containing tetratricopeptide repeat protein n=1 Tax=Phenylobacterium sp. TaxID=1871053 RepID=UPI002B90A232|nr:winged helix-turn-helix domain-containing protein [Phenylobacterium sp.]HSV02401.1 winged helix-turn-helix domain-containing protein [Phenylobacterium sp.]
MIYRFGAFRLDTSAYELRAGDDRVAVEPQVLALIRLLIENRHRLVGRDEIIERIWNGRIVSEAAISSRIKSARRALGDDGAAQRVIRTVPKLGLRFVAPVEADPGEVEPLPAAPRPPPQEDVPAEPRQSGPSLAVLPFAVLGAAGPSAWIAEALPHDLITALSRFRWLFVIARGSSFHFRGPEATLETVREALKVRYCLSGAVEIHGSAMGVSTELSDTRDGRVLWSERFEAPQAAVHEIRQQVTQAVIGALELQIPLNEARRAQLSAPESLDAWSAYHLGLHHMYRFNREGTARAAALFEQAIALEPSFARAHAGLSFAQFETAFLSFTDDATRATALAKRAAEAALERDALDPFCNLVMGRAFWLTGELEASLPWIERAIRLNPNYAQAKYARGWSETLLGKADAGRASAEAALALSPLDPLAYGMLGVRALSHMVLDEPAQAAEWGEQAARAPGAHPLIEMIAAVGHAMNGEAARAAAWAASARRRNPNLRAADFLQAFPFRDAATRRRVVLALERLEMPA